MDYDRLVRHAAGFAARYRTAGVGPGDIVLLVLHHTPEAAPAFLGAMLIGAIPSFMAPLTVKQDPRVYWRGMATLFERIGARLVVTFADYRRDLAATLPDLDLPVLTHEEVPFDPATPVPAPVNGKIALLQHSSGTTGVKKGVALSHRAILTQVDGYAATLGLDESDVIATWLPLYHDMGLNACLMPALVCGVPLVALDPLTWVARPTLLWDAVERYRCTLLWQPNFAFHHLAATMPAGRRWDLSSLRAVIDCAEPCKPESFERLLGACADHGLKREALQVCYAMAENVFAVTQTRLGRPVPVDHIDRVALAAKDLAEPAPPGPGAVPVLSCGTPVPGVRIQVVDEAGASLPDRRVGEITVAGGHLFDGYFRQPEETARRLRGGWYHTGDLGYRIGDDLYVTGRKDDLLIVYGRNYYAHEVEHAVGQVAGLIPGRAVALGIYDPEIGSQEVVLLAERAETGQTVGNSERAVGNLIKMRVLAETGLMIKAVRLVPPGSLIKTSSGKISRRDNLGRYLASGPDGEPADHG